jgi:subtilisin family serine protease
MIRHPFGRDIASVVSRSFMVAHKSGELLMPDPSRSAPLQTQSTALPNDPRLGGNWALDRIGAFDAWLGGTGEGVTVAVLDTGVDTDHEDLAANMWVNAGEIAGNGRDDDGNGFADDIHGWNFSASGVGKDVEDRHGHGTHVAGLVGAVADNGKGIAGVAPDAQIMAVKVLSDSGSGSSWGILQGIDYAIANGAKVINMSLGGSSGSWHYEQALARARDAGVIVVAAAGNDGRNEAGYPAHYTDRFDNVISVAASNKTDVLASWSNWSASRTTVDLAAPGTSLLSTVPGNGYGTKSGTSMATPVVAGAVAVVWDAFPDWSYLQVIDAIEQAVDQMASLSRPTATNGILNLAQTIATGTPLPEAPVNEAPTLGVAVRVSSVREDASIGSGGLLIADVTVSDDGVGVAILSLSGADMADFELRDGGLFLRAGAVLDFETRPELSVTLSVDDPEIGTGPEDEAVVTLMVTDVAEGPTPTPPPADGLDFHFSALGLADRSMPLMLSDLSGAGRDAVAASAAEAAEAAGGALRFDGDDVYHIANDAALNLGTYGAKSLSFSIEIGSDIASRQVVYEQGGVIRGLSVTIEDGALYLAGWNLAETSWGVEAVSTVVTAGQQMAVTLVHDAGTGMLSGYVDGALLGAVGGVGTLYAHGDEIGLGGVRGATVAHDGAQIRSVEGFRGGFFEAAAHGRALGATEVAAMHAGFAEGRDVAPPPPEPAPEPSPVPGDGLDFHFSAAGLGDGAAPLVLSDLSGAGRDAAATDATNAADISEGGLRFDGDDVYRIENDEALNLGIYTEKSLSFVIETGADILSRQVVYEQGGALRGLSVTIEDGALHFSGWNLAETQWGVDAVSVAVAAGGRMAVTLVHDAVAGTLSGYLDGALVGSMNGIGTLYAHGDNIGLGGVQGATLAHDGARITTAAGFEGRLFEAAAHGRALAADEVAAMHAGFAETWGIGPMARAVPADGGPVVNPDAILLGAGDHFAFTTAAEGFDGAVRISGANGEAIRLVLSDPAGTTAGGALERLHELAEGGRAGLAMEVLRPDAIRFEVDRGDAPDLVTLHGAFVADLLSDHA